MAVLNCQRFLTLLPKYLYVDLGWRPHKKIKIVESLSVPTLKNNVVNQDICVPDMGKV